VKALVWHGTRDVAFEELPEPEPSGGDVVLDVERAGICGSDLHGYRGHPGPRVPPLVLGHEVVGRFDGAAYAVYPLIGCGECEHCRAGADNHCSSWRLIGMHRQGVFAERVALPQTCLVPLPEGIDHERAVLVEPLACCVGALAPHADAQFVAVLGCGPLGLLTVYLARRGGAHVTAVDPLPERRAIAARLGAADTAAELDPGEFDLVVDAAGFEPTWRAALAGVRAGGTVVMLGLGNAEATFPMAVLVRRAVTLRGQFAYTRAEFARALEVLAEGDLPLDWVSTASLADGAEAFANLVDRPAEHAKIVLTPA
jgi:2-desacetyl-2-hydroxyethyl bacteriochlorophyllide A dehydrogenase